MTVRQFVPTTSVKPDWVVVALPVAVAIRPINGYASLFCVAVLTTVAMFRKHDESFRVNGGPLVLLFLSSAIVLSRPESYYIPILLVMLGVLVLRLVMTVDARRIIASIIDGFGLLLVVNVLAYAAGISPRNSTNRITGTESTGFVRAVFPLAGSINSLSILAGAYLVAALCVFRQLDRRRRRQMLWCSAAAIYVILGAGSRTALAVTVILAGLAVWRPFFGRWMAQVATVFSAVSAAILPGFIRSIQFVIEPLAALNPGRETTERGVASLQGRDYIWANSIDFWNGRVDFFPDKIFGFGAGGQYRSGAFETYATVVSGSWRQPEFVYVHNAFLQQLFDGGIVGAVLLACAVYWTGVRFSARQPTWGAWAFAATFALTALLLGNMTEVSMAPAIFEESFWLLLVLVAVACQAGMNGSDDSPSSADTAIHYATGHRNLAT